MAEILFLVHRAPWPPDRGDRIRSWHLFDALRRLAPVHVAALADSRADAEIARARLAPLAASVTIMTRQVGRVGAMARAMLRNDPASLPLFAHADLARDVAALIAQRRITHIVAFSSQMAQYVPASFDGNFIMDFVDVDSAKFESYAHTDSIWSPMRWVHAREGHLLARYEAQVAARADASLFVSEAEAALFRRRTGFSAQTVRALDNGIDLARFAPDGDWVALTADERGTGPLAVFTGQMDYRPNIDAVAQFAMQTLPLIRQSHRHARFAIVGRAPTAEVRALSALPGVIVTGEVPDTRPWLAAGDVVVAPLLIARGVQNKLLEAMAMARPVVASSAALEGIDVVRPEQAIAADGAEATAHAVTALFNDDLRANAMGAAARARMVARYGWAATMAPLAALTGLPHQHQPIPVAEAVA